MKLEIVGPVCEFQLSEKLPRSIRYLIDIGMDLDQIKEIIRKYPPFVSYSLEKRIKPVVESLLDLGISQSDIPSFILNAPNNCWINLSETTIPTLLYLKSLGVDIGHWIKTLNKSHVIFRYKKRKVKRTVDFLYEIGLSTKDIANVITQCPKIVSVSVDNKLRPIAEYFRPMGVNVPYLLCRFPSVFLLNLEENIKPLTNFLLDKGFSKEEIGTMAMNYGTMYLYKMEEKVVLKLEFFLTMGYPRSELVKFPRYFRYGLRKTKQRFKQMMESGMKVDLRRMLLSTDPFSGGTLEKEEDGENTWM